ncbi:MAG: hypothetical protein NT005_01385 [Spirochaetes bacterium]|nr:hypothetical protein [Spirochaetota bacterium]
MPVQSGARTHYSPRGLDPLRRLFCQRFPAFRAAYEKRYAAFFGSFRPPLIARAASAFRLCGDWSQGIARIRCPDCGYALFLHKGLLNPDFAHKLLGWMHSGFTIKSGTRIYDQDSREALCQCIVRDPLLLEKIHWDEDTVTWKSSSAGYFKGRERRFSGLDFIAQVTLNIPPRGRPSAHPALGRPPPSLAWDAIWRAATACIPPEVGGTWKDRPALCTRAPQHWYGRQAAQAPALPGCPAQSRGKQALPQESLGTAACHGLRAGRAGLPHP